MMKMTRWLLLASLVLLPLQTMAAYDDDEYEPPPDEVEVKYFTGYQGSSADDAQERVAEYDLTEPGPLMGLSWWTSPYDSSLFGLWLKRIGNEEYFGAAELDLGRMVRVEAMADGLLHRLDHDPTSNLQAVEAIKVTRRTDLEPDALYGIRRSLYAVRAEFQHPNVSGFKFRAGLREQRREGTKQILSTSHCTSCHTVSQGREVDRSTTEASLGFHVRQGLVDIDYQLDARSFQEDGATPTAPFEEAFRPSTPATASDPNPTALIKPFQDRLWFQNGDFAIDQIPDIKRTAHTFKVRAGTDQGNALNFTLMQSTTENRANNLDYDFQAIRGRYSRQVGDDLRLNFFIHREELENDSVFIDLERLVGPAPVQAYPQGFGPVTFQEWRDGVFLLDPTRPSLPFNAYLRNSAMDRTETRLGADALWRPWRRASLRLGYRFHGVDRNYVILGDGDGKTSTHKISLGWNQRIRKKLRWNNSFVYKDSDNPYVNVDGAWRAFGGFVDADGDGVPDDNNGDGIPDAVIGFSPTPAPTRTTFGPRGIDSLQYYELHALRQANVTNVPATQWRLRSNLRWSPTGKWALMGNVRLRDAENDELDFTAWDQSNFGVGANLWVAAGPKFHATLGVDHVTQETDAFTAVPIMDG